MSMYIDEQMRERMRQIEANRKQYTENSIDEARARFNALQEQFEAAERQPRRQMELRPQIEQARQELDDALRNSGHLATRKKARELQAQRTKERDQAQAQYAAQEEAAAKEQYRGAFLAHGGTEAQFEAAWGRPGGLWEQELERRRIESEAELRHRSPAYRAI
jgi:cysteinyl-tRNA synthetase